MKYCVVKGTTIIIDGSENSRDVMEQNAKNVGLSENDIEILTESQFFQRKESEPKPTQPPTIEERLKIAEETINFLLGL